MNVDGFEQVLVHHDADTGLHAITAIHDTTLGPALGGVRMRPYADDDAALADALSLAEAMTLKAAAAGLHLGGGWSVLLGDPARDKDEALLRAYGRHVATLGGRFIPVNDVGTTQADLRVIGSEASPVCDSGDPSPWTALGVVEGIRACLRADSSDGSAAGVAPDSRSPHSFAYGTLSGVRVAIQGVGNVGSALADLLAAESADLLISDTDPARAAAVAARTGARIIDPAAITGVECDVLAPCALGATVTDESLSALRCRVIAGGANNVLAAPHHAEALQTRGVLYAPDFCVNAGGLIYLEERLLGHDDEEARARVRQVGDRITDVISYARRTGITTTAAAAELARARLRA